MAPLVDVLAVSRGRRILVERKDWAGGETRRQAEEGGGEVLALISLILAQRASALPRSLCPTMQDDAALKRSAVGRGLGDHVGKKREGKIRRGGCPPWRWLIGRELAGRGRGANAS